MNSPITTHVLDTSLGRPAAGVPVVLEMAAAGGGWKEIARAATDSDGRLNHLLSPDHFVAGTYRLTFDTGSYFASRNTPCFYPVVAIVFTVHEAKEHFHVPLLLGPYGYSTYRGS